MELLLTIEDNHVGVWKKVQGIRQIDEVQDRAEKIKAIKLKDVEIEDGVVRCRHWDQ